MSILSEKALLSQKYTNHCIRVTSVTNHWRANFNAKQVMVITDHKSVESLAVYERVKEDEKLMMGMCLTYSLFNPEKAIMIQNNIEVNNENDMQAIIAPPIQNIPATPSPQKQIKELIPLENAIAPYQPPKNDNSPSFDLMQLIADVEKEEIPDCELLLAATQCEQSVMTPDTNNTTRTTSVMKRANNPVPTFSGCTFGPIGTLNIHIHKS